MEFRLPSNKVLCIWHDSSKTVQEEEELNRLAGKWDFIYWLPEGISGFLTWRVLGKKVVVAVTTQLHPQVEIWEGCGNRHWLADRSEGLGEKKKGNLGVCEQIFVPFLCLVFNLEVKKRLDLEELLSVTLCHNKALIWYQEEAITCQHILLYTDDVITIWFCQQTRISSENTYVQFQTRKPRW